MRFFRNSAGKNFHMRFFRNAAGKNFHMSYTREYTSHAFSLMWSVFIAHAQKDVFEAAMFEENKYLTDGVRCS